MKRLKLIAAFLAFSLMISLAGCALIEGKTSGDNSSSESFRPIEHMAPDIESSSSATSSKSADPGTAANKKYVPLGELPDRSGQETPALVEYKGGVEHIFFHPLIAYPERAWDGDYKEQNMDDYFCTVTECKRILEELYRRDYILVDYNDFYEAYKDESGKLCSRKKYPKVPEGKKPLVISIDDVNYYSYMLEHGTVSRLILDDSGTVATLSKNMQNGEVVAYDNDVVVLIDAFCRDYPDFSFEGAKGLIGLTGFEGILGYRTDSGVDEATRKAETAKAQPIVEALKNTGWAFASHSYGHPAMEKRSAELVRDDCSKWDREVKPLIGDTTLYIYPYGSAIPYKDARMEIMREYGFTLFCGVGPYLHEQFVNGLMQTERVHVDGISLRGQRHLMERFFDTDKIVDLEIRDRMKNTNAASQ